MTLNSNLPVVHGTGGSPAYSDKVRRAILASLKIGTTRTAAYLAAEISEATFYRWMKEDESFREAVASAEGYAERSYTRMLRVQASAGDTAAIKFWLERRRSSAWREKVTVQESSLPLEDELDEAMEHDDVDSRLQAITDEALRRRASGSIRDAEGAEGEAGSVDEPS